METREAASSSLRAACGVAIFSGSHVVEAVDEAAAVDVESFEDAVDGVGRDVVLDRPENDVQVLFAGLELIEDGVEKPVLVLKLTLQQAEVPAVEFHPEAFPLKVFHPPRPQVARPVFLHPLPDTPLAEVVAS